MLLSLWASLHLLYLIGATTRCLTLAIVVLGACLNPTGQVRACSAVLLRPAAAVAGREVAAAV